MEGKFCCEKDPNHPVYDHDGDFSAFCYENSSVKKLWLLGALACRSYLEAYVNDGMFYVGKKGNTSEAEEKRMNEFIDFVSSLYGIETKQIAKMTWMSLYMNDSSLLAIVKEVHDRIVLSFYQ